MRLSMKFRQRFKFSATAFLMLFGAHNQTYGQQSEKAVMTVSVRVLAAPEFKSNIITDITDQLQERGEHFSLGDYIMKFPAGKGYTLSFDPVITMQGKTSSWDIKTNVHQQANEEGLLTLRFTGQSTTSSIPSDQYLGRVTTRIAYH